MKYYSKLKACKAIRKDQEVAVEKPRNCLQIHWITRDIEEYSH